MQLDTRSPRRLWRRGTRSRQFPDKGDDALLKCFSGLIKHFRSVIEKVSLTTWEYMEPLMRLPATA